jgi:hypothetical protein
MSINSSYKCNLRPPQPRFLPHNFRAPNICSLRIVSSLPLVCRLRQYCNVYHRSNRQRDRHPLFGFFSQVSSQIACVLFESLMTKSWNVS